MDRNRYTVLISWFTLCLCLWFVHRWSILIIVQWCVTQSSLFIILQIHCTRFGCQPHPSWGVYKTVTTASSTAATSLQRGQAWPRWREVSAQIIWQVREAVVTVLCIPDDGCGWHPKHVEWTCRIINRLLCVASRWTTINVFLIYFYLVKIPKNKNRYKTYAMLTGVSDTGNV